GRARWFRITGLTAGAARMGLARDGVLVDEDEVDGPRLQICAGNLDLDAVAETVCLSRLAPDQTVGAFVVLVVVVVQIAHVHHSFDEQVRQLNEDPELRHSTDDAREMLPKSISDVFDLLELDGFALGLDSDLLAFRAVLGD